MQGEKDVTLRYDLTVPFARYVAMHEQQLAFPFMRYQVGKVYRGEKNQKGRFREFYQCDIDIVGRGKLALSHDALVIFVASCVLKAIGLEAYCMRISNRKLMKGLVRIWHLEEKEEAFLSLLDKYMKLERKVFNALLEDIMGKEKCEAFLNLLQTKDQERLLAKLEAYKEKDALFDEGLDEVKKVLEMLAARGISKNNYQLDLSIIRGLDYYTGTVFETFLVENEGAGSICAGGRYENLTSCFTADQYPGVGCSIGLSRLFILLKESGFFEKADYEKSPCDYLILSLGEDAYALMVYQALQQKGYRVMINLEEDKLKKKMNYANKLGAAKVILLGEEEKSGAYLLLKDMVTGAQTKVSINDL